MQHLKHVAGAVDDAQNAAARAVQVLLAPPLQPRQPDQLVPPVAAGLIVAHLLGRNLAQIADDMGGRVGVGVEARRLAVRRGQPLAQIRLQRQRVGLQRLLTDQADGHIPVGQSGGVLGLDAVGRRVQRRAEGGQQPRLVGDLARDDAQLIGRALIGQRLPVAVVDVAARRDAQLQRQPVAAGQLGQDQPLVPDHAPAPALVGQTHGVVADDVADDGRSQRDPDAKLGRVPLLQLGQRLDVDAFDSGRVHRLGVALDERGAIDQLLAAGGQQAVHAQIVARLPGAVEGAGIAAGVLGDGRGRRRGRLGQHRRVGRRRRVGPRIDRDEGAAGGEGGGEEQQ